MPTPTSNPPNNNWHSQSLEYCFKALSSSVTGLKSSQIPQLLKTYGQNKVVSKNHFRVLKIALRQFWDLLIILLIISAFLSYLLGDNRTTTVIVVIVIINLAIGFFQEYKAERIMRSLKKLVNPTTKVLRDGVMVEVNATRIVPGDVIRLEAGDSVAADLRLFEADELKTNNYALTGESMPSLRTTKPLSTDFALAERINMAYMGTTVAAGSGFGVVVATGMHTELGTIATLSQEVDSGRSPLQKEISHLSKRIAQGTAILTGILVLVSLGAHFTVTQSFIFAIGIAAAMIPQGLAAEVNVALAQAANKLARQKALVKRLSAVETLGATQIICTDKTGTLTKNEMTVTNLLVGEQQYHVEGSGFAPSGSILTDKQKVISLNDSKDLNTLMQTALLASDAQIHPPDSNHTSWYCIGDPTEGALVTVAKKTGLAQTNKIKRIHEFSFDSDRKRMSTINHQQSGYFVNAKGAPESILSVSTHILINGVAKPLTLTHKKRINNYVNSMSRSAMRNIALAYKPAKNSTKNIKEAESKLIFLGVASMIDPPREEVAEAMQAAQRAHMQVSIITGDQAATASAIAQRIGFGGGASIQAITPQELHSMSDSKLVSAIKKGNALFARVSPSDKLHIVSTLKRQGLVIAVTGDGVNDAPALHKADIGVAMGLVGSDVAKESAEIVLLDDSFHTLVNAISLGRVIFQNIKKATLSCLTSNSGELVAVLISVATSALFGFPIAITVLQILAIDLMAELFPIAALGWDKPTSNIMDDKPRKLKDHILNLHAISDLAASGLLIGGLAFINFLAVFWLTSSQIASSSAVYLQATTVCYVTIVLCQYGNILSRRTGKNESMFTSYLFTNYRLWLALGFSLICVLSIIYIPLFSQYIGNAPLMAWQWLLPILSAVLFVATREIAKTKFHITV